MSSTNGTKPTLTLRELPACVRDSHGDGCRCGWHKLLHFGHFEKVGGLPDPRYARILVLEHDDQVVGCWMAMNKVWLEGLHITEEFRGPAAAKMLLLGMLEMLQKSKINQALTIAPDAGIGRLATTAGFEVVEGTLFHWTVKEK